jgi:hypothetical protein
MNDSVDLFFGTATFLNFPRHLESRSAYNVNATRCVGLVAQKPADIIAAVTRMPERFTL